MLIITESAPANQRGFFSAWSQVGVAGGFVLSSGAFFLVQMLPSEALMSWGWRIPFLLSIVIFGLGIFIRTRLPESREFAATRKEGRRSHMPVVEAITKHPKSILLAMGLRVAENGGSYIFLAFSLAYGKFVGIPSDVMLLAVLVSMTIELGTMIGFGALSDRIGRRPVYLIGAVGIVLVAFPFFWLIESRQNELIFFAFVVANPICHAAMIGTQPSLFSELFSTEVRYSGVALGHEIASVFAGGLSPLIATALLVQYRTAWPVALYVVFLGLVTVVALLFVREPLGQQSSWADPSIRLNSPTPRR